MIVRHDPLLTRAAEFSDCEPIDWLAAARNQQARLWRKITKIEGGCWLWRGRVDRDGYGQFMITSPRLPLKPRQKAVRPHRLSWELKHGPLSSDVLVLHKCDVRRCCNPDHLFLGTQADNVADMVGKGRHPHGPTHGFSKNPLVAPRGEANKGGGKLTNTMVLDIVRRGKDGETGFAIARSIGVSKHTVNRILSGHGWTHVTGMTPRFRGRERPA